jgi:HdeA/HdeB family
MSKAKLFLAVTMLTIGLAPASRAEMIADMSKLTCAQLLEGSADSTEAAIWLSGYYNGLHKNTKLDLAAFMNNAKAVVEECHSNPKKTVMHTIDGMMSHK